MASCPTGRRRTWSNWRNSLGNILMDKGDKISWEPFIVEFGERRDKAWNGVLPVVLEFLFYYWRNDVDELLRQNLYYLEAVYCLPFWIWAFLEGWYGWTPDCEGREIVQFCCLTQRDTSFCLWMGTAPPSLIEPPFNQQLNLWDHSD